MRRNRTFRFAVLIACSLVVAAGFFTLRAIFEAERLHAALIKINKVVEQSGVESLTRADLESTIGRPPDFVLPPATDSADGLTELYWARVVARGSEEAIRDALNLELDRGNPEYFERVPGALLQGILLHAYVTREGVVYCVIEGEDAPRSLSRFVLEQINRWISALSKRVPMPQPPNAVISEDAPRAKPPDPFEIPEGDSSRIDRAKRITVGAILIAGNDRTPDAVILKLFGLGPGSTIGGEELRAAAGRLADSGLFVIDPSHAERPRVQVLDLNSDAQFKDAIITISDRR